MKRLSTVVFSEVDGFLISRKKICLKPGPFAGMKYLDFQPTFVEPIWNNTKGKKIAFLFLTSLTFNKPIEIQFSIFLPVPCLSCRTWYYCQVVNEPDPDLFHFHTIFSKVLGLRWLDWIFGEDTSQVWALTTSAWVKIKKKSYHNCIR